MASVSKTHCIMTWIMVWRIQLTGSTRKYIDIRSKNVKRMFLWYIILIQKWSILIDSQTVYFATRTVKHYWNIPYLIIKLKIYYLIAKGACECRWLVLMSPCHTAVADDGSTLRYSDIKDKRSEGKFRYTKLTLTCLSYQKRRHQQN